MTPPSDGSAEGAGAVVPRADADADARAELAVVTRRLGIDVPADLADGVLHGYRALREMTALLRRAEPERPDA
ncbi:MAG: hypothetical protein ACJ74O_04710 [Frankiaceae bacterium]